VLRGYRKIPRDIHDWKLILKEANILHGPQSQRRRRRRRILGR
jgi:hypothetical protein